MKTFLIVLLLATFNLCFANESDLQTYSDYCIAAGGNVENMPAQLDSHSGLVEGFHKDFCTFRIDNGFIAVGLETFGSPKPNIAATLIKQLPNISYESALFQGKYTNPSLNFCKNLGGSSIAFLVPSGGFSNELGQTDICVFGDGSMVSGWSLIYIANGRTGYNLVKEKVKAAPIAMDIPQGNEAT